MRTAGELAGPEIQPLAEDSNFRIKDVLRPGQSSGEGVPLLRMHEERIASGKRELLRSWPREALEVFASGVIVFAVHAHFRA
jgi:hypothetical protein